MHDATRVNGVIYAVGASTLTSNPTPPTLPNLDTAVVWDSATNMLTPLPDVVTFNNPPTSNNPFASAITPDGQYIASRARSNSADQNNANGVRVTRSPLTNRTVGGFGAVAISDGGTVLASQNSGGNTANPAINNSRALRTDVSGPTNVTTLVPLLGTYLDNLPAYHGLSADGSVLVGTAFTGAFTGFQNQFTGTNGVAFRWVHPSATVSELPRPSGGTWSVAITVSPSGNLTLVGGNSTAFPNGEVWVHNASTNENTYLGSPNAGMVPRLFGGMSADGSVVAVTYTTPGTSGQFSFPAGNRYAYIHNSHGWFNLGSILAASGIDLAGSGWDPTNLMVTNIRTVDGVDLVVGQGRRRSVGATGFVTGAVEGFVAELPAGTLAAFNPAPTPPTDQSIVGTWYFSSFTGNDLTNPTFIVSFLADGTYLRTPFNTATTPGTPLGVERGRYAWAGNVAGGAIAVTTLVDTDGTAGFSSRNGEPLTLIVTGDSATSTFTNCATCPQTVLTRVTSSPGSVVGGWIAPYPAAVDDFLWVVLTGPSGGYNYYMAGYGPTAGGGYGAERGIYSWDAVSHEAVFTPEGGTADRNTATLSRDELGLHVVDDNGVDEFDLVRIVAPSTVLPAITNATLEAGGAEDTPFSFTAAAVNAVRFEATGLPSGLSIDEDTGVISGTSAVNGTFNVQVTVTNTFGDTHVVTFVLTFAAPPARFYGIGDLPGGALPGSAVRDATRANGTLYAVGASSQRTQSNLCNNFTANDPVAGCAVFPNLDTPVLWTDAGTGTPSLVALPEAAHSTLFPTNGMTAHALTPNGQYIASQYHATANSANQFWVRVTNAGGTLTNQAGGAGFVTWAISDNGSVLYGQRGSAGINLATRHVFSGGATATTSDVPLPTGVSTTISQPVPHGTTSDGSVMVGVASNGNLLKSNGVAFRYSQATGVSTPIPMLPTGGTWNYPLAISGTGAVTLLAGNSTAHPNGEIYLTDAAGTVTATLGSPSEALSPYLFGGMTQDGAVVAVTFGNITSTTNPAFLPNGGRYAFIHNSHGWFHLSSVLAAQGVNLVADNWDPTNMAVTGVRTVEGVDLVYGEGRRRVPGATGYVSGAQEGFVVELPAGTLAAFDPQPVAPSDQSIVGTWLIGTDPANPVGVLSNFADGTFIRINLNLAIGGPNGVERGLYTWAGNAAGGAFATTTLYDSDGTFGVSARNGQLGLTIVVAGDTGTFTDTNLPGVSFPTLTRVAVSPGSIVGGWINPFPMPTLPGNFLMAVFTGASGGNKYYFGAHGPDWGGDGVENGTFTWDAVTQTLLTVNSGGVPDSDPTTATLAHDELALQVAVTYPGPVVQTFDLTRIVAPSSVLPEFTGSLSVSGTVGFPFSFAVATTHALTVSAPGLPPGLNIDPATGVISGTPTTAGASGVLLTAENTFGSTTNATFTIDISAPAVVVVPPGDDVTIEPEVPTGTPDVTLTFDNVTGGGETTVAVIDPETTPELAPEPPGNFEIVLTDDGVPLYYDIQTTAAVTGPTTICFSYADVDFGGQTPRLFHYVDGSWVDITSSVDEATQTLCGTTTSFSPFAIFKSAAPFVSATGFYAPVSQVADFVNTAKAGSTVPLKFNVTVNGAPKTDTTNLYFSTRQVASSVCSASPEDQVDYVTVGETDLRYDAKEAQFIQNWKLPKTTGCVMARITYRKEGEQEVVLISAKFSLK